MPVLLYFHFLSCCTVIIRVQLINLFQLFCLFLAFIALFSLLFVIVD